MSVAFGFAVGMAAAYFVTAEQFFLASMLTAIAALGCAEEITRTQDDEKVN